MFPLFKAAAVVAIILTLGNAAQYSFNGNADTTTPQSSTMGTSRGQSMAYIACKQRHNGGQIKTAESKNKACRTRCQGNERR